MKRLFFRFSRNFIDVFRGKNLVWHVLAIVSTYFIVKIGFDWKYFVYLRGSGVYYFMFSAAAIGGLMPILLPIILWTLGKVRKSAQLVYTGFAVAQAAIMGSLISSLYKSVTGRAHPDPAHLIAEDITHLFKFGFMRGGIFWGWPSSHTTVAFAMVFTLWALFPKNKKLKIFALVYALYIGIGVSMTIHWFSDFVAGAIIGTVIGTVVGRAFKEKTTIS